MNQQDLVPTFEPIAPERTTMDNATINQRLEAMAEMLRRITPDAERETLANPTEAAALVDALIATRKQLDELERIVRATLNSPFMGDVQGVAVRYIIPPAITADMEMEELARARRQGAGLEPNPPSPTTAPDPGARRYVAGCDAVHPDRRGGQHTGQTCMGVLAIEDGIGVLVSDERSQMRCRSAADALLDDVLRLRRRGGKLGEVR